MFWGLMLEPGKKYSQTVDNSFHVSMASLESNASTKMNSSSVVTRVMVQHDKSEFLLCSLVDGVIYQQSVDLNFTEGEEVTLYVEGTGTVHLTGYLEPDTPYDDPDRMLGELEARMDEEEEEEEEEDDSEEDDDEDDDMNAEDAPSLQALLAGEVEEDSDDDSDDGDYDPSQAPKRKAESGRDVIQSAKKKKKSDKDKLKESVKSPSNQKEGEDSDDDEEEETREDEGDKENLKGESKKKGKKKKKKNLEEQTPAPAQEETQPPKRKKLSTGVILQDIKEGDGKVAKDGKMVFVYYKGILAKSKEQFDACLTGKPFGFRLGKKEVIPGWDAGVKGMKVGGKRKLIIPASQGYGSKRTGPIPPNSTLIFTVELKSVK